MFSQLFLNGIIAGSIYALITLDFTVIYKTARFLHFVHGVIYTAGAIVPTAIPYLLEQISHFFFSLPLPFLSCLVSPLTGLSISKENKQKPVRYLPVNSRYLPLEGR